MDEHHSFHPVPNVTDAMALRRPLQGLCSLNGGDDVPCLATDIMPDKLTVKSVVSAAFADEAVLSLPHIGLLKGPVAQVFEGGFTVAFEPSPHSKLGLYLDWLDRRSRSEGSEDARRFHRVIPIKRLVALARDDEPASLVRIVDLSRSGVAFTSSKAFRESERVRIGNKIGVIVRLFNGGAAAHFDQLIDEQAFDVMIDLDKVQPCESAGETPNTRLGLES